ncbi:hypothetical protein RCH21_001943 [Arthrobacter sp. PL16]|uniref:hypothetical protein n=1 Tax=Arthrobacter sp. PL16 TaxID=3071720 RepID=UPI002DFF8AAB|nr:hypothetical protein [Arthrobacter sp. PL16]
MSGELFASESGGKRDEGRGGPGFSNDVLKHGDYLRGLQRRTLNDRQRNARLFVRDVLEPVVPAAGVQRELEVQSDYVYQVFRCEAFLIPAPGFRIALLPPCVDE